MPMGDHLLVTDAGLFSSIQDFGRFGFQRFGISASGAMDNVAMSLANALVGNPLGAAVIEMALVGAGFTVEADGCRIAVAGGDFPLLVNGRPAEPWAAHDLARGDRLKLGLARAGARCYLAVAGGFAIEPVLGSCSTHSRSAIGGLDGGPLKKGDALPLNRAASDGSLLELPSDHIPRAGGPLRVLLGPQDDAFSPAGIETFLSSAYTISQKADRMGCQLEGPVIEHRGGFNIVSDGIMNGSIQVPGNGRPIVLLADRQSTGGYPKIATVIGPDLYRLAQRRPGDIVHFRSVSEEEAANIARRHAEAMKAMLHAIRPTRRKPGALDSERLLGANLVSGVVSATNEPFDSSAH
jgi:biotin-dependent carboxylase-like uncharacterized protein